MTISYREQLEEDIRVMKAQKVEDDSRITGLEEHVSALEIELRDAYSEIRELQTEVTNANH